MRRDFVPPTATAARGVTVSKGWLRITTFIEPAAYGAGPFFTSVSKCSWCNAAAMAPADIQIVQ